jgi:hypothetical protein
MDISRLNRKQMQEFSRRLAQEEHERYLERRRLLIKCAFDIERQRFLYGE